MDELETSIHETLLHNSSLFLQRAVEELPIPSDSHLESLARDRAAVACVFVQFALELATKARVLKENGLVSIVDSREHASEGKSQLHDHFTNNTLKTKSFEMLRQHMVANPHVYNLSEDDHSFISTFQKLRNKIVHLNYRFHPADLFDLNDDMIFLVVHTIPAIHNRTAVFDFFVEILGRATYLSLVGCPSYVNLMERKAKERNDYTCKCIECGAETADFDLYHCQCCGADWSDDQIGKTDCIYCGSKKSVLYDRANLASNGHIMPARCLACNARSKIYECPNCNEAYDIDSPERERCTPSVCLYQ